MVVCPNNLTKIQNPRFDGISIPVCSWSLGGHPPFFPGDITIDAGVGRQFLNHNFLLFCSLLVVLLLNKYILTLGRYCEVKERKCDSSPCQHGATCTDIPGGFYCTCLAGFTGNTCNVTTGTDGCDSVICLNGGRCHHVGNLSKCICPEGYHGHRCENKSDRCQSSTCHNGGTCVDNGELLFCKCAVGFIGKYCEKGESGK